MSGKRALVAGADPLSAAKVADLVEGSPTPFPGRQDCLFRDRTILVPGRYVENHWMHGVLLMLAQNQAGSLLLVEDARDPWSHWSAGFTRATTVPALGVVVADGSGSSGIVRAEWSLREAGCDSVVRLPDDDGRASALLRGWMADRKQRDGMSERGGAPCTM